MRAFRRLPRPTRRGLVLLVGGMVATVAGVALGVTAIVQVGLLALLAVATGGASVGLSVLHSRRRASRVSRVVAPDPMTVGESATVTVDVQGSPGLERARLSERAAAELSGGQPLRARVTRAPGRIQLAYTITPSRRGRWSAGPLQVHLTDVLGTAAWSGELGPARLVAVRPPVTAVEVPAGAAALDTRAASGSRSPAPDDTSLRDYRAGDDPRRVHWRSTARRGELVVRQDERAGRRPATVLLDLPTGDAALEWTIATGVSVAVALVESGHQVRLLAGGRTSGRHRSDAGAADALLDLSVDLVAPADPVAARAWLIAALAELTAEQVGTELVVAVLGAVDTRTQSDLARIGAVHDCLAMVRLGERTSPVEEQTVTALRRGGWLATPVRPTEPVAEAWRRVLETLAIGAGR